MNETAETPPIPSTTTSSSGTNAEFCAILVLDQAGVIVSASSSATVLSPSGSTSPVGKLFVSLFVFEVASAEPEFLGAQWEALVASSLQRPLRLGLPPGGAVTEVSVRIEPMLAHEGYLATVQPVPAATVPIEAAPGDDHTTALGLLATHAVTGFFDLNLAAGRFYFSPAWKKLLGYAPSELPDTLETWHQLIHSDDSAAAPDKLGRKPGSAAGARSFNVEFRMKRRDGGWSWVQCLGIQLISAAGELERVIGFHLDISERKDLEETSLDNDARLQDLSGTGPLAAFELDFTSQVFWYSPAWQKLLGYENGTLEPVAASFGAALPAEQASVGVEAWFLDRAPGQTAFLETVRLRNREGRPVPVILGVHRTISRKRELLRVVGFAVPLPGDAALEPGALPVQMVVETFNVLAEGVIVVEPRGRILFANPTAARLLRSSPEGLHGRQFAETMHLVNRQSGRPADDPLERALTADQPLGLTSDDALAQGQPGESPLPIVWTARAIFGPDGKARGVAVIFRNPEEMTLTPEELLKANRFESLGLLAGGIAHDFNNLLTTILGAISLAKDNRDYSALDAADKACTAAKGLTKQLLSFAKGGAATLGVWPADEILADSIKIAAAGSVAEIALNVSEGTEPVMVNREQILQVFQNLIVNALQAMPPAPHRPKLQVRASNIALMDGEVPGLAGGAYVEFEVRDNGMGIKPEHVEKIFDPFFTTKKHGTGLGLATVLSIVRKHGGQIGLDTQVGVGTAFTVYLPKADKPPEVQARRSAALRFGTGRVLFMDDDPKISTLTANMLQSLNYRCDLAKNGEEAITLYKRYLNIGRPYDAVIMDLTVVGGMGGEECFEELIKLDPDVRAIVASGYDNEEMARQFIERGFCGYLTKPYRVNDLGKVLKTVLG